MIVGIPIHGVEARISSVAIAEERGARAVGVAIAEVADVARGFILLGYMKSLITGSFRTLGTILVN